LVLPTFCLELKQEAKPVTFITYFQSCVSHLFYRAARSSHCSDNICQPFRSHFLFSELLKWKHTL